MFCMKCGATLEEGTKFCSVCGEPINEEPQAAPVTEIPVPEIATPVVPKVTVSPAKTKIPEENSPLSPWSYFGLQILYSVPLVGFIFLIIFSFNGSNINRRNFTRSYWCGLLIVAIAVASVLIIALVLALLGMGGSAMGNMGAVFGGGSGAIESGMASIMP